MAKKLPHPTDENLRALALVVAVNCVRNTVIEDYHAEGKLNDTEMMAFNKEVANKLFTYFKFMFGPDSEEKREFLRATEMFYPSNWDKPELDSDMIEGIEIALGRKEPRS